MKENRTERIWGNVTPSELKKIEAKATKEGRLLANYVAYAVLKDVKK